MKRLLPIFVTVAALLFSLTKGWAASDFDGVWAGRLNGQCGTYVRDVCLEIDGEEVRLYGYGMTLSVIETFGPFEPVI